MCLALAHAWNLRLAFSSNTRAHPDFFKVCLAARHDAYLIHTTRIERISEQDNKTSPLQHFVVCYKRRPEDTALRTTNRRG